MHFSCSIRWLLLYITKICFLLCILIPKIYIFVERIEIDIYNREFINLVPSLHIPSFNIPSWHGNISHVEASTRQCFLSPHHTPHTTQNQRSDDPSFLLRPEYVESLFILYRITKDDIYRERAWDAFQMIEKYCKYSKGYTSLRNVFLTKGNRRRKDEMPSYFLGETLKYLLLIFSPDDYIDLHEFVFTTEAHPLRQIRTMENIRSGKCDYATTTNQPTVLSLNMMFFAIAYCIFILARMKNPFSQKRRGNRKKNQ